LGAGFLPGTLSVILAAQGIGKSLLMTDLISGIFVNTKNVLLVSLEMLGSEVMKRVHANSMDLPINSLIDLSKTEKELNELTRRVVTKEQIIEAHTRVKAQGNCGKLFIKNYPAGSFSPLMLEQLIESFKIEKNIEFDIVFVDYLGIMKSDLLTPSAGLYSYLKSIGEEVRAVADKQKVPIISANQLNRNAINQTESVDNSSISDSIGTAMTADFMLFLLQDESMKEQKEIVCKVTKNRFTGITDTWMMSIDYEHMRFEDKLVQGSPEAMEILDSTVNAGPSVLDDFGIVTAEKQERAEVYANNEIKEIVHEDIKNIQKADKKDPFNNDMDDLFKDLGID